jgi:hypothetical protein
MLALITEDGLSWYPSIQLLTQTGHTHKENKMARPPKETKAKPVSTVRAEDVFTDEELLAMKAEAEAEHKAEQKELAAKALKEKVKEDLRRKDIVANGGDDSADELEEIYIDLASHSNSIVLDGITYFHGVRYQVTKERASSLRDIMYRGHAHQAELSGNIGYHGSFGHVRREQRI